MNKMDMCNNKLKDEIDAEAEIKLAESWVLRNSVRYEWIRQWCT